MKLTPLTHQEAKFAHQQHYDNDFEVIAVKRSGWFNFFPFSLVYGISDYGGWDGLMSTDGKKLVITKAANFDSSKVVKTFTYSLTSVVSKDLDRSLGKFIGFDKAEKGLTRSRLNGLIKLIGILTVYPILFLWIYEKFMGKNKYFVFGIEENYGRLDNFKKLINK